MRIFEHNFVADKAKIRRRADARQGFLTQYAAKFAEKTCAYAYEDRFWDNAVYWQCVISAVFQYLNIKKQDDEAVCKLVEKAWYTVADYLSDAWKNMLRLYEFKLIFLTEPVWNADNCLNDHTEHRGKSRSADAHFERKYEYNIENDIHRSAEQDACHCTVRAPSARTKIAI